LSIEPQNPTELQPCLELQYSDYARKSPTSSQDTFHRIHSYAKGFSGPVGTGKTASLCHEAIRLAYANPGLTGVVAAPTYTMLRDNTRALFFEILDLNGIPYAFRAADNEIRLLEPDSVARFRSLDNPLRLMGSNLAWFGIDELTYSKEAAWSRMLARVRHPLARELCRFAVWTPKGFDWVYQRFVGPDKHPGHETVFAKPGENPAVGADYYQGLKSSYDEQFYRQEVLGEYLAQFTGQIYFAFKRERNCRDLRFDAAWPVCWTLDFNIDPMSSAITQVIDVSTREDVLRGKKQIEIRVLDEIVIPDCRTSQAVDAFLKRVEPWLHAGLRTVYLYGDATGSARQRQSLRSDWDVVKATLREREPLLSVISRVPEANGPVRARTNMVNGALYSAAGTTILFVDPRCKELLKDFDQLAWPRDNAGNALDSEIPRSDPKRGHMSDAVGYLVVAETKPRGGPRSNVIL
jgi:hypothetical protein